jgi:Major Facilitator Superfamily
MDELGPRPRSDPIPDDAADGARAPVVPLLAGYWSFGQYWGVWVILVFEYQRHHGIGDARLGLLYTFLSIVAVVVMLLIAPRMQPLSLRTSVTVSLATLALASAAIGFLPGSLIALGFVLVGAGNGLIDVYLNVAAQRAETQRKRPVLQWLHASYALGGVTGAAAAALVRAGGLDYRWGFAYAALALAATTIWNAATASRERAPAGTETSLSISTLSRTPALWIPALAVLFAFLVEGSMDTWSGLYLRDGLGASATIAAVAFMAFSARPSSDDSSRGASCSAWAGAAPSWPPAWDLRSRAPSRSSRATPGSWASRSSCSGSRSVRPPQRASGSRRASTRTRRTPSRL